VLSGNKLFYGDNLDSLRKHVRDETVDLCYIDPPFNSKRNYNQIYNNVGKEDAAQAQAFVDTWTWDDRADEGFQDIIANEQGRYATQTVALIKGLQDVLKNGSLLAYLVSITRRIVEIHRALKSTGSFYLHCDPTSSHYLKLVADSVFLSNGGDFKNEIIWRRTGSHNKLKRYGPIHDVILFYTKSLDYFWSHPKRPYMRGHVEENFVKDEAGYRTAYYGNVLTGSGLRGGESGKPWKGIDPSEKGRHWAIPGALVEDLDEDLSSFSQHEKLDRFFALGQITLREGDAWPIYERRIKNTDGQALSDLWTFQPYTAETVFGTDAGIDEDVRWLSPKDAERLGYQTQKPEGLMERIIRSSCPANGIVLDAYSGCGTTVAVAQRLNRAWIGMDVTYQAIALILKRLGDSFGKDVAKGVVLNGAPKDMESATALARKADDRTRKEFEKWAVLTYTENRGAINDKKGADSGIDGTAYFLTSKTESDKMVFQVKSGHVGRGDIARLKGDMQREKAALATFITLEESTGPMRLEAKAAGFYTHSLTGRRYDRIQIVSIKEMLERGRRMDLPLTLDVVESSEKKGPGTERQTSLDLRERQPRTG
jgi:DNA modification methylase